MILVDIYVPSLDKTYDFQVDETIQTEKLIMEITEMIGNDVKTEKKPETENISLRLLLRRGKLPPGQIRR